MASKKVKVIKVENKLKEKTGMGEISENLVQSADNLIKSNQVDFSEIALPALARLRESIRLIKESKNMGSMLSGLIDPVMELKANGAMFKYSLVSDLAAIMLSFLEHIDEPDSDVVEIIDAHERTLSAIVTKRLKGDGGPVGIRVRKELEDACERYYHKNPLKFKAPAKNPKQPPKIPTA